jgi:hypothetical protein
MSSTVVLHVGLMKSGTTFVQQHLFAHRELLAENGVLQSDKAWSGQVAAAKDVLDARTPDRWTPVGEEFAGHDGLAVMSMEFFAPANRKQRRRIVAPLQGARLEVVITVRDLNRTLVARWQEMVQNGKTFGWTDYLDGIRDSRPSAGGTPPPGSVGRAFWRHHDLAAVARRWGEVADRVTVVTVPPPGADRRTLLDRFTEAAGLPQLPLEETRSNESLGAASILALLRLNELLAERDVGFLESRKLRKELLAKRVFAARRRDEPRLGLPVADWLAEETAEQVRRTSELPVRLIGDWADLTPVPVPGIEPADVSEADVAEAAIAGMAALVQRGVEREDKA